MKLKRILCSVLTAAVICCASSCGCSTGPGETTSGGAVSTSANGGAGMSDSNASVTNVLPESAESDMPETDENKDGNGHYDVTDDGMVTDADTENSTENGEPDEAAYASSYMNIAANGLSLTKIGWGLGKDKDGENRPTDAVKAEEKYKDLGARFLPAEGKICLTFDEGYENGYTAAILDTLKQKNVKAIFFVTYDYCRTSPELVRRMIDEGHTVGNHSYTHPSLPDCSDNEIIEEVSVLHDYVAEQFGYEMTLFRFPKGEFSENSLNIVKSLGYTSVFWSFAYNDWDTANQPDPAQALQKISDSSHSGIYLLHAVSETNAQILGDVIENWRAAGFQVGADL